MFLHYVELVEQFLVAIEAGSVTGYEATESWRSLGIAVHTHVQLLGYFILYSVQSVYLYEDTWAWMCTVLRIIFLFSNPHLQISFSLPHHEYAIGQLCWR